MPAMNGLREITPQGTLDMGPGAIVVVETIGATLINDGVLSIDSPGSLTVQGIYQQTPSGVLDLVTDSANFTFILATLSAVVDGQLAVATQPGFTPVAGSQFTVLSALLITGSFDSVVSCNPGSLVYALGSVKYTFSGYRSSGIAGDLNGNGTVNGVDLGILLAAWGSCSGCCNPDLNHDSSVDGVDLGILLANWTQR